jgi:hypothetical protein
MEEKKERREKNPHQIIKVETGHSRMEFMNSMFDRDKMVVSFMTYDSHKAEGSRLGDKIDLFIDIPVFLTLINDTLSSRYSMMMKNDPKITLFEDTGGTTPDKLRAQNRPRNDTNCEFRKISLCKSSKEGYSFLFSAESGPGKQTETGGFCPINGYRPEKKIAIPVSAEKMKEIVLITQAHINAFLSSKYTVDAFEAKRVERDAMRNAQRNAS